ncbi:MAG TPA: DUF1569 domain-containing protein [Gemmatimonadaceae bacterium]|nr:DUF1569 domain-containing protein [Gemmatimonadaceae bacterium]
MPKSLWNARERESVIERLGRLSPDARPRWGRMNAPQMLAHLARWMQMADGGMETADMKLPYRYPPLKQLVIYWLPWPQGVPTAPELVCTEQFDWASESAAVRRLVHTFEKRDPRAPWPVHPAFGKLTSRAWGVLGYRHIDHHFRQFGV